MDNEETKNTKQNSLSFHHLISRDNPIENQDENCKQLYLIVEKELSDNLLNLLKSFSNHFNNHLEVWVVDKENKNLITSLINRTFHAPNSLCLAIGTHPFLEDQFFSEAEKEQIPFNMGNCSSSGKELTYEGNLKESYREHIYLTNLIQFGLQLHLSSPVLLKALDQEHFEYHRIGQLKKDITQVEPLMRDINYLRFDLNCLKNSEFPAKFDFNPSGLESEEALQVFRYASLSPKMNLIHLNGFHLDHIDPASLQFIAQAIWYISHGLDGKISENPFVHQNVQEYIIEHDFYSFPLSFLRSKKSGRWWMKIPSSSDAPYTHIAIACDANDYQKVIEGEIPYRLLKALERGKA